MLLSIYEKLVYKDNDEETEVWVWLFCCSLLLQQ